MPPTGADMDVDGVADELYALPPREFVAARDGRAKEARAAGDHKAAAAISALRRPTVVAWLANLLVRHHFDEVSGFVDLGAALRDATETLSGPELRDLSRQRHQLVHALVGKARALGEQEGQRVGEDSARGLEETLHAALADPAAADELMAGRLTAALTHTGYEQPASGPKPAARKPPTTPRKAPSDGKDAAEDQRRAARRQRIERDLGEAWAAARRTADARDEAEAAVREVERRRTEVTREARRRREEMERLRKELAGTEQELGDLDADLDRRTRARDRADADAARARQRVTDLQARLDDL